jgi:hypothetical protein
MEKDGMAVALRNNRAFFESGRVRHHPERHKNHRAGGSDVFFLTMATQIGEMVDIQPIRLRYPNFGFR